MKGKRRFVNRMMNRNDFSLRAVTSYSGKSIQNLAENERQILEKFQEEAKRLIKEQQIKQENFFNSDQTGIYYANAIKTTIEAKDIIVSGEKIALEKKRISFMPLINMEGKIFTNFLIFKGKTGFQIDFEIKW